MPRQSFSSLCLLIEDQAAFACLPTRTTQRRHANSVMARTMVAAWYRCDADGAESTCTGNRHYHYNITAPRDFQRATPGSASSWRLLENVEHTSGHVAGIMGNEAPVTSKV